MEAQRLTGLVQLMQLNIEYGGQEAQLEMQLIQQVRLMLKQLLPLLLLLDLQMVLRIIFGYLLLTPTMFGHHTLLVHEVKQLRQLQLCQLPQLQQE
jgi:hypothetical protein